MRGWLDDLGVEPTADLLEMWFSAEQRHIAAWHRGEVSFSEQRRRRLREILPRIGHPAGDDDALDEAFVTYLSRYEAAWRRFDDVDDALDGIAKAGLIVAVLTNGADH